MTNNNFLSPLNYYFSISRLPNVEYSIQSISIPGIQLNTTQTPTPFVPITSPTTISFGELSIVFKISEDLSNWLEIFNWMVKLGHPNNLEQYEDTTTDCKVLILNSSKKPILSVDFYDVIPTSLSPLDFDSTIQDVQYLTGSASFNFNLMEFKPI